MSDIKIADRIKGTEKNVWVEFTELVSQENPVDLGRGFPDFNPPVHVKNALITAATDDSPFIHQYARVKGHKRLVTALAELYSPIINHNIDWATEILITNGAYGALHTTIQGLINPGDEVIIIEPFFDCYSPMVKVAGGTPIFIPLRKTENTGDVFKSSDFTLDYNEFSSKITKKTKALIFNNPNNPIGKVYSLEECQQIAKLCKENNIIVICDEVYEWITYDDKKHIKMASLPDMFNRTLTLGSAGKSFSVTGWKIGWIIGPVHLMKPCVVVHQNVTNSCSTPMQEAIAIAMETDLGKLRRDDSDCYFKSLAKEMQPKRDLAEEFLKETGFHPVRPDGGYFILVNYTDVMKKSCVTLDNSNEANDYKFIKWMIRNKKISAIPVTVFYSEGHKHLGQNYIRFCFMKVKESFLYKKRR
ncbi:DgyrCDS2920 [Dimorphilus gyrociliatus]|uniref:DgyrCDS2920 n=1 Tax=Dimorphilus gyrociliatus TaxID=2664684 RepID=A0A7I8VDG2_9ANNE|nr:DgyrCDS2920 [Dimorphilus gyrociliatus]